MGFFADAFRGVSLLRHLAVDSLSSLLSSELSASLTFPEPVKKPSAAAPLSEPEDASSFSEEGYSQGLRDGFFGDHYSDSGGMNEAFDAAYRSGYSEGPSKSDPSGM